MVDAASNAPEIEGNARDKLEHALWVALLCQCSRCSKFHNFTHIEDILDENLGAWSALAVSQG